MATLIRPPPNDTSLSIMENMLQLTQLSAIDPNMFTNTRQLWHPPGARGIYGGAVIAQCLSAAQQTVPQEFTVHSMHCYFVLAGNSEIPVMYHVERVRDGRSFCTRTVQARQRARVIFTTTISFMHERNPTDRIVQHDVAVPDVPPVNESSVDYSKGPFESRHSPSFNGSPPSPEKKRTRMWLRTRGAISSGGGHEAHLNAVAYMSDSFFIGTVARAHKLWRDFPANDKDMEGIDPKPDYRSDNERSGEKEQEMAEGLRSRIKAMNGGRTKNTEKRPEIGMMVSLDHTIYFHRPRAFRADEWLLSEMYTPWAGDNRGLVMQHIWTHDGQLVATCVQEGLVRLKQEPTSKL